MKISEIKSTEFHPYFKVYIDKVGDLDLFEALKIGAKETSLFFESIPESKLNYRYSEGKWTVKDILLHLVDTERVFCYRALSFARSKNSNLEGFDENIYVDNAQANSKFISELLAEYIAVRNATILLFKSFSDDDLKRMGKASDAVLSVRAAGFIICGHEIHHKQIIKERYL